VAETPNDFKCRGCETWVVREGYEGLVRGNIEAEAEEAANLSPVGKVVPTVTSTSDDVNLIHNLRFGDGDQLKDGTADYGGGRSLKGRYIVRVGWDDVRGWFAEVRAILFYMHRRPMLRCMDREEP